MLRKLCAATVATIKGKLEAQKQSDAAKAKRLKEEEARCKADEEREQREEERRQEDAKLAEARERAEKVKKMAEEQMDILRIERELQAKKQAYSDAQKAARIVDDAGDDEGSDSAPEDHSVRYSFIYCLYSILITLHSSIRGPQSRQRHVRRESLVKG